MTDVNISQFPTGELVSIFSRMVDESKGDISAILKTLNIPDDLPSAQSDKLKEQLKLIASGKKRDIQKFVRELKTASKEAKKVLARAITRGGITKFKAYWWGCRLYVSHSVLEDATDIGSLVAAISAICGPTGAALAAAMGIAIALLKIIDRGNGIILTRYGWVGPVIPTRQ